MKRLAFIFVLALSLSAFADTNLLNRDIVTVTITDEIKVPTGQKEIRTSCGILLKIDEKSTIGKIPANTTLELEVTSITRFWTRLTSIDQTQKVKKVMLKEAKTFESVEALIDSCTELSLVSIKGID